MIWDIIVVGAMVVAAVFLAALTYVIVVFVLGVSGYWRESERMRGIYER